MCQMSGERKLRALNRKQWPRNGEHPPSLSYRWAGPDIKAERLDFPLSINAELELNASLKTEHEDLLKN